MNEKTETQRELLIRIDERQKSIENRLKTIEQALINPNEHLELMEKVDKLWDWKNKIVGYAVGASAVTALLLRVFEIVFQL